MQGVSMVRLFSLSLSHAFSQFWILLRWAYLVPVAGLVILLLFDVSMLPSEDGATNDPLLPLDGGATPDVSLPNLERMAERFTFGTLLGLVFVVVSAPLQFRVQRQLLVAEPPLAASYQMMYTSQLVWKYIFLALMIAALPAVAPATLFMLLSALEPSASPDSLPEGLGRSLLVVTVLAAACLYILFRIMPAPALLAIGCPDPLKLSWEVVKGNVFKLFLVSMAGLMAIGIIEAVVFGFLGLLAIGAVTGWIEMVFHQAFRFLTVIFLAAVPAYFLKSVEDLWNEDETPDADTQTAV